jgi:hypothetical protein
MARLFSKIRGRRLHATDGEIGSVSDLYFHDDAWDVRYLVIDVGSWLAGRTVLLAPHVLGASKEDDESVRVSLTKEQIRNSPDIDTEKPISRQYEEELHAHYGWPPYWEGGTVLPSGSTAGINPFFTGSPAPREVAPPDEGGPEEEVPGDVHLRSANEIDGYRIRARDGEIGSVADLLVDEDRWRVRYLVIKTGGWFTGDRVLISPEWIQRISWAESSVHADLDRQAIAAAPPYDPRHPLTREDEERLYRHHSRKPYWG